MKFDVVIIGGGPAGIVTGVTVKKYFSEKSVLILTEAKKGLVPCGIPYVFNKLDSVDANVMGLKPFLDMGGYVIQDPVVGVQLNKKEVYGKSGETYQYDKLVFATGSTPAKAEFIKGYDLENVFYIKKNYQYIKELYNKLKEIKRIVIIGGGFIGAEVAEQLAANPDKEIILVESEEQCFSKAFSKKLSKIATEQLRKTGVQVRTDSLVEEIVGEDGKVSKVKLKGGEEIPAEAVILSVGYKPNTELAAKAGLPLNNKGAIKVDSYERTSVKDVCAVGDCSQTIGFLTARSDNIMLASTATAEARVLGYNMFGIRIKKNFLGTIAVFSTQINGLTMASAGVNENTGKDANVHFMTAEFTDVDKHPGTLPDARPLTVRLVFSPSDGIILGGEVWGGPTAAEIINIISMAIQKYITVYELISYQIGTHPLLTSAPTKPVLVKAAEKAIVMIREKGLS
ncbi:MAG: FAD-dependent oxidoreductase [Bacteroidales bacterium]|nr:FAD-dependent oxidoreductase [Bacteroidales bacterium]